MMRRTAPLRRSGEPIRRRGRKRTSAHRRKRLSLSRQADMLWSTLVKLPGRCYSCGSVERLQAAHGFSRRHRGTRWLLINGFPLCSREHVYWTHRPLEFDEWLRQAWGQPVYDELRRLALKTAKVDLAATVAALRAELEARK